MSDKVYFGDPDPLDSDTMVKCAVCGHDTFVYENERRPEKGLLVEDELCLSCECVASQLDDWDTRLRLEYKLPEYDGIKEEVVNRVLKHREDVERKRFLANEGKEPIEFEGHTYKWYTLKDLFECTVCGNKEPKSCVEIDGVKHCIPCAEKKSKIIGHVVQESINNILEPFPVYPWESKSDLIVQIPKHIFEAFHTAVEQYNVFLRWVEENIEIKQEE